MRHRTNATHLYITGPKMTKCLSRSKQPNAACKCNLHPITQMSTSHMHTQITCTYKYWNGIVGRWKSDGRNGRKQNKTNKFTRTMEGNVACGQLKEILWLWITETLHVPSHVNIIQHKHWEFFVLKIVVRSAGDIALCSRYRGFSARQKLHSF